MYSSMPEFGMRTTTVELSDVLVNVLYHLSSVRSILVNYRQKQKIYLKIVKKKEKKTKVNLIL
jgi:hypothetical protein